MIARSPLLLWLPVAIGAWACVDRLPIEGSACPCPDDYVCVSDTTCTRKNPAAWPPDAAVASDASVETPLAGAAVVARPGFAGEIGGVAADGAAVYVAEFRNLGRILRIPLDGSAVRA